MLDTRKLLKEYFEYDMDIHFQGTCLGFKSGEPNNLYTAFFYKNQ